MPKDFPGFLKWYVTDDYNHYLYSRIIEFSDVIPFNIVVAGDINNPKEQSDNIKHRFTTKKIIKKLIRLYEKYIPDCLNQIVLVGSSLNTFDLIKLQLSLKQAPYLFPPDVVIPEADIDLTARGKLSLKSNISRGSVLMSLAMDLLNSRLVAVGII